MQRLNLVRPRVLAAEPPVFQQFPSMYHRPFLDEVLSPARYFTLDDLSSVNVDRGFELTISGVKVWWGVVIELKNIRTKIP